MPQDVAEEEVEEIVRTGRWPLALVAEDKVHLRELTVDSLRRRGVAALVVGSLSQAADTLAVSPRIDVALLDIHLDPDDKDRDDRGGIAIAKLLRTASADTPIIGYSGKFSENRLSREELNLFDQTEAKGGLKVEDHQRLWDRCVELANISHDRRQAALLENQDKLRRLYEIEISDAEVLRRFKPDGGEDEHGAVGAEYTAEGALGLAGFKVKVITLADASGRTSRPVVVWSQHSVEDDGTEWVNLEMYGHPGLYATGLDCKSALSELAEYVELVARDIDANPTKSASDATLAKFLHSLYTTS